MTYLRKGFQAGPHEDGTGPYRTTGSGERCEAPRERECVRMPARQPGGSALGYTLPDGGRSYQDNARTVCPPRAVP
ncbi:hypothetical protein D187_002845 [Cystobacter fuscus DSM 2262]|uniref:Uncharacterized protein n=1 Tax=Cystobacter fuscus (strain ATCC 25194 / DSM 2262 / NBRC 100088 / M29) TaxID=1242864 RepID=S9P4E8_CYSF2|nr:hypothetical protein D187_002845 [Cystobacter fuscus DSM 2262]